MRLDEIYFDKSIRDYALKLNKQHPRSRGVSLFGF
jgi:hypothetical protein